MRGGAWNNAAFWARCASRYAYPPDNRAANGVIGFRCARRWLAIVPNGPVIDSITPTNDFNTTDASVQMQIVAHSPAGIAQVTVNGNAAQYAENNAWSYVAPLSVGTNTFTVIVTDNADHAATGTVQYVRLPSRRRKLMPFNSQAGLSTGQVITF